MQNSNDPWRVFVTHNPEDLEAYFGRSLPPLRELAEVVCNPLDRDLTTAELIEQAAGCDVIIAHRSTPGPAEVFAGLPELKAMLRTAVDISTIDVDAATEHGVLVGHADKSFVDSTAEIALGLYLAVARSIAASTIDYRNRVEPPQRPGWQIRGKTAAILGYGAIGQRLAEMLNGLGLDVVVHDPFADEIDYPRLALNEALEAADVVFPLVPGGDANTNFISTEELEAMKPGAVLVNVSRGEVLDDDAVIAALDSGQLVGVGLDVGRAPDQRPTMRLAERADVVATPHLGGLTPENADAQAHSAVEQVAALIAGDIPPRAVNAEHAHRLMN